MVGFAEDVLRPRSTEKARSLTELLRRTGFPSAASLKVDDRVRLELAGNLCRCTGYVGIVKAVRSCLGTPVPEAAAPHATPQINGIHVPKLEITANNWERWRFLSGSWDAQLELVMARVGEDGNTLKNSPCEMQLLAKDGRQRARSCSSKPRRGAAPC